MVLITTLCKSLIDGIIVELSHLICNVTCPHLFQQISLFWTQQLTQSKHLYNENLSTASILKSITSTVSVYGIEIRFRMGNVPSCVKPIILTP